MNDPVIVIPARISSGRVPGKVLIDIEGKSVIERVWEAAMTAADRILARVVVAVDSPDVREECERIGAEYIETNDWANGSERVAEVAYIMELKNSDWIINLQGDKVGINPEAIVHLYASMQRGPETYHTLYCMHEPLQDDRDGVVKVVVNREGNALYFTRRPLPGAYKHSGIYGYTGAFLRRYITWGVGALEQTEGLEQMRVLEHGCTVKCIPCPVESGMAINTPDDVEIARTIFRPNQDVKQVAVGSSR